MSWQRMQQLRKAFSEANLYQDRITSGEPENPITFVKMHIFQKTAKEIYGVFKSLPKQDYDFRDYNDGFEVTHKSEKIRFKVHIGQTFANIRVYIANRENHWSFELADFYRIEKAHHFTEFLEEIVSKYQFIAKDFGKEEEPAKAEEPEKSDAEEDLEDDSGDEIDF